MAEFERHGLARVLAAARQRAAARPFVPQRRRTSGSVPHQLRQTLHVRSRPPSEAQRSGGAEMSGRRPPSALSNAGASRAGIQPAVPDLGVFRCSAFPLKVLTVQSGEPCDLRQPLLRSGESSQQLQPPAPPRSPPRPTDSGLSYGYAIARPSSGALAQATTMQSAARRARAP